MAREGSLYPAVILHGGDIEARREAAVELARTLLCCGDGERPCGACPHCRRIGWPEADVGTFHPDFMVLQRDLRTATSVEATRGFLRAAHVAPFEAAGQVFVLADAETLGGEAANALLKVLEEPPTGAGRHFLLLAPSRFDLLPTLRSRSMSVYLGGAVDLDREQIEEIAAELESCLGLYRESRSPLHLLAAAAVLAKSGGWDDPRSDRPWSLASAATLEASRGAPGRERRSLLALAEELLQGSRIRVRGIAAPRILEGLVGRHLAG
jgi:hypothetical protein